MNRKCFSREHGNQKYRYMRNMYIKILTNDYYEMISATFQTFNNKSFGMYTLSILIYCCNTN
ncbi:unnamed protein product [Schistosoma curassoni]|uniref:Uncharacterized protein n=1 Tax=Schistosoma curassoni TaxID=6186 RepID=A0A183KLC3_9TREM|nr:unnamed protein product [Schistosoma curassoni]